jgi:hypothetical protein
VLVPVRSEPDRGPERPLKTQMSRNLLYAVVGVLAVVVVVLGVALQHEREKAPGVTIELKNNGVALDRN